jgi:2-hydroxychromene-2-carboxylate isomerase
LLDRSFAEPGRASKDKALRIASALGIDAAKLQADMHSPSVEQAIAANKRLADRLNVQGVPFYLVGDRPLPGSSECLYDLLMPAWRT